MVMTNPLPLTWRKDEVPEDLAMLRFHIDQLARCTRDKLLPLCERIAHFTQLQSRLVEIAQDAVDQLQLDVKYLQFDLEITRKERDDLQRQLRELGH